MRGLLVLTGAGFVAQLIDGSLATGKLEPRKVIGSVDTSEFLVALRRTRHRRPALRRDGLTLTNRPGREAASESSA